jgi:hypothetical protein
VACLNEFTCAVYADGELPENEAREVAEHLSACGGCRRSVEALRTESRVLVQCFHDTDFIEFELEDETLSAPHATRLSVVRFGLLVLAMSALLRPVISALAELELPEGLDWMNPFNLSGQMNLLANTLAYVLPASIEFFASILNNASWIAAGAIVSIGVFLLFRKSALKSAILSVLALLTVFSSSSYAFDVRTGNKPVTVPAGETIDDTLVVAADSVIVDGTITGDLIAGGRQVTIRGTVKGNLFAFASQVDIEGTVEGSIIGFAQTLETRGQVGRNVYAFAQTAAISRDARIGGNAAVFAADTDIEGTVGQDFTSYSGRVDGRPSIGRNFFARAGSVSLHAPAHIGGTLTAKVNRPENALIESGVTADGRTDIQVVPPAPSRYSTASFYLRQLIWLAAAFITGLTLFWLLPGFARINLDTSTALLLAGGVGFLTLVVTPIAAVVAAVTLVGLPIGLIMLTAWMIAGYLAKILIAGFLGRSLLASHNDAQPPGALALLAGLIPVFVAINLPYVGGVINFILIVLGLGAFVITTYQMPRWRAAQAA